MARRIDYLNDPKAPDPTSLVPSVNVVVEDDADAVLLIRRTDNDNWALPGGAMDLGETLVDAAVRETLEETGIEVAVTGLVGIYTSPHHVILYTSNGEVRQEFSVVFRARQIGGSPTTSSESSEVAWMTPDKIPSLAMHPSMRQRIAHHLEHRPEPYLG